jgi:hypothetical protein
VSLAEEDSDTWQIVASAEIAPIWLVCQLARALILTTAAASRAERDRSLRIFFCLKNIAKRQYYLGRATFFTKRGNLRSPPQACLS